MKSQEEKENATEKAKENTFYEFIFLPQYVLNTS